MRPRTIRRFRARAASLALACAAAIAARGPALAAGEFPQERLCSSAGTPADRAVDPELLLGFLFKGAPVDEDVLKAGRRGTTLEMSRVEIVSDQKSFCDRAAAAGRPCKSDDLKSVSGIRARLTSFAREASTFGYSIQRNGAPVAPGEQVPIAQLVDPSRRTFRIVCVGEAPKPEKPGTFLSPVPRDEGLRITGKLDDLSRRKGGGLKKLDAVEPASLSVGGSRSTRTTTVQADIFLGFGFDPDLGNNVRARVVPFVSANNVFSRRRDDKKSNLGAGILSSFVILTGEADTSRVEAFSLAPHFVTDDRADTRIMTLKASWVPGVLYALGPIHAYGPLDGGGLLRWRLTPRVLFDSGFVFADGGNAELRSKRAFVRAGAETGLAIRGGEDTILSQFEVNAHAKYMFGPAGAVRHLLKYGAELNYILPGQEHLIIGATFDGGRAEDTLEKDRVWRLALKARF